jgi:Fe-S-cluster containining protein
MPANNESSSCQACGACCSYSRDWPRFTTDDDADLDMIPASLVDTGLAGMRCDGNRCSALVGEVGTSTSCSIYEVRPDVCRACTPGDDACQVARESFGIV